MSPQCCRCNGNGHCKGCQCARSGRICTNCTPSRNGKCENLSRATASEVATQPPEALLSDRQATTTEGRSSVCQADRQTTERTHGRESLSPNNHPPIVECASAHHQQHNSSVSSSSSTSPNLDHAYDESTFSTPTPNSISLPNFLPAPAANLRWDDCDGPSALQAIDSAYAEVVHWRCNTFMVPSGKAGKDYVREQARLLTAYADGTALEQIALKAAMLMPKLLLHKPHPKSKTKEHTRCLERRLHVWSAGNFEELIKEGKIIQQHLPQRRMKTSDQNQRLAKTFASLMLRGKVRAALRLLSENSSAGAHLHRQPAQPPSYRPSATPWRHTQSFSTLLMATSSVQPPLGYRGPLDLLEWMLQDGAVSVQASTEPPMTSAGPLPLYPDASAPPSLILWASPPSLHVD